MRMVMNAADEEMVVFSGLRDGGKGTVTDCD